jgi:protein-tyrosine phosphatase
MGRRGLTWPAAIAQLRQHRPQVDPHPLLTTPAVRAAIVESVQAFLAGQTEVLTAARSAAAALWTAHHHRPPAPNVPEGAEIEPGLLVGTRATPAANALVLDLYHLRPDTPNDPQTVQSAVDQLRAERRAGRTVLVRCCDGKSLSALVVALALMAERAWDWPTALWYIRQRQPGAWPRPQSLLGLETLIWLR